MNVAVFTNDDNVSVLLPSHHFSHEFRNRDKNEVMFRRINTYLIKNKIIKNNIVDSGAWIGDNSIPWAKNIDGTVYAIDPCADNCDFINITCQLNNIQNVLTIKSALSNVNETLTTNDDMHHCSFVFRDVGLNGVNKTIAVSLDCLYESNIIKNIGYIHLDVEGMEYKAIVGGNKLIDECRPIITFEQHLELDDYNTIVNHLNNKNYTVFLIDEVLPTCRPDCRNFISFPNEIYSDELMHNINNYIGNPILILK